MYQSSLCLEAHGFLDNIRRMMKHSDIFFFFFYIYGKQKPSQPAKKHVQVFFPCFRFPNELKDNSTQHSVFFDNRWYRKVIVPFKRHVSVKSEHLAHFKTSSNNQKKKIWQSQTRRGLQDQKRPHWLKNNTRQMADVILQLLHSGTNDSNGKKEDSRLSVRF